MLVFISGCMYIPCLVLIQHLVHVGKYHMRNTPPVCEQYYSKLCVEGTHIIASYRLRQIMIIEFGGLIYLHVVVIWSNVLGSIYSWTTTIPFSGST